jgi:hypothetical protein
MLLSPILFDTDSLEIIDLTKGPGAHLAEGLYLIEVLLLRISTVSMKLRPSTAITKSIGLKFFLQSKHLARLVSTFVAVWKLKHSGQRNRSMPQVFFISILSKLVTTQSMGISLRIVRRRSEEKYFGIEKLLYGR